MFLILLVLNNADLLEKLLIAWEEKGVQGATVLFSTGLGRIRQLKGWRDDMPLIPSINDFYGMPENLNRTVFTTAWTDEEVDGILEATRSVIGDLDETNTGLLLVLPIARAYGVNKEGKAP